jgi:hypothetical protein
MVKEEVIKDFWDSVLKGESKTYNDHNWYTSGGLKGYIEGQSRARFPYLTKPLSEYTIGEVLAFQAKPRDANGQLWATGKYQIIPDTLKGLLSRAGLTKSDLYNKVNQDKLGFQLLMGRPNLANYIKGSAQDTLPNLQKASLDVAKIWSSVGVPYPMKGAKKRIQKDESYYSGGGDRASTSTDLIQTKLKELRARLGGKIDEVVSDTKDEIKEIKKLPIPIILVTSIMIIAGYMLYKNIKK